MDSTLIPLAISALTGLTALVASFFIMRRYQALGGGEAQKMLNATYQELNLALESKIQGLTQMLSTKDEAMFLMSKEIGGLRDDVRTLRTDLLAANTALTLLTARVKVVEP